MMASQVLPLMLRVASKHDPSLPARLGFPQFEVPELVVPLKRLNALCEACRSSEPRAPCRA